MKHMKLFEEWKIKNRNIPKGIIPPENFNDDQDFDDIEIPESDDEQELKKLMKKSTELMIHLFAIGCHHAAVRPEKNRKREELIHVENEIKKLKDKIGEKQFKYLLKKIRYGKDFYDDDNEIYEPTEHDMDKSTFDNYHYSS